MRGDAGLRERVERLAIDGAAPGILDRIEGTPTWATPSTIAAGVPGRVGSEQAGDRLGRRYELVAPIGDGGMGSVWMADQVEPVRRRAAVKLIKPGMDSAGVLARFDQERQALALMDHPSIAKVFDACSTDAGGPFFAMEYVEGLPITQFCDAARLDLAGRLELFAKVCLAVRHAHAKGVVHRDLKPSNVLGSRLGTDKIAR